MSARKIPAIRVSQPLGEFYLAAIPANFLLKVGFTKRHTRRAADESGAVEDDGHQRRLDEKRLKEIARYLETQDAALPNTIILAANCRPDGEAMELDDPHRWCIAPGDGISVELTIPTEEPLAAIVDGQHRLFGFEAVSEERKTMPLACAIFLDLPIPQQASVFATINYNQKPVSKSQTYELFGYNLDDEPAESWSPEKLAVFFARKLNVDPQSPLCHRIQVAAQDDRVLDDAAKARGAEWSISTATIVESIMRLISANPKDDRDRLHMRPLDNGRHRQLLGLSDKPAANIKAPMRALYLEVRDIVIYGVILNYLTVVDELFWQKPEPGFIRKTIGIQALFDVLTVLLPDQLASKDLTKAAWLKHLEPAAKINFGDRLFHASGSGRTQVKKALLLAIGRLSPDEIDPSLRADFDRALGHDDASGSSASIKSS
jgi:DNA phosphorothioation-associated DGQHR protein 1